MITLQGTPPEPPPPPCRGDRWLDVHTGEVYYFDGERWVPAAEWRHGNTHATVL